ncbi:uncharacterized protein LOC131629987 [Vicia villosa]|uniref:uncharacterized protein LOC131602088 n=1 Tax=Vicia villosa TaxID=3911 RepID=UPI00273C1FCE|nr:uncharacterized protein LOC131602088 [Vicia villosa]XP_058756767.1 uncharacterized protein LOC131629987 [Vicia villosa]
MEVSKYLSLFAIYIILLHNLITFAQGNDQINKVCEKTPNKDLCTQILTSDPLSEFATMPDLAMISLRVAASNATGILTDVKIMIDDPDLDPEVQQGLADCKETLLDAEGQLEDSIAAILSNTKNDIQLWLQAALAAIDTCDASIPGDDDILSKRSVAFRELCNIAVAISKNLGTDDQA